MNSNASTEEEMKRQLQTAQHDKESTEDNALAGGQSGHISSGHIKDPSESTASGGGTDGQLSLTITTNDPSGATSIESVSSVQQQDGEGDTTTTDGQLSITSTVTDGELEVPSTSSMSQQQYEESFPSTPETQFKVPRAATTYAIFSDAKKFATSSIYTTSHYLADELVGTVWLDTNGDGIRGDSYDRTLNALEYDTGVGGVKVQLVSCDTNQVVKGMTDVISLPKQDYEGVITAKKSLFPTAGEYKFDVHNIPSGRYYTMYQAPPNTRMNGNILPLDVDANSGNCIPRGEEGAGYIQEVVTKGDLDYPGYCGRSIGCFGINPKFELKQDYGEALITNDELEETYEGTAVNLVALAEENMLNVGIVMENWPLKTSQSADATITLKFPGGKDIGEIREALVPESFQQSRLKHTLEWKMAHLFKEGLGNQAFDVEGVNVIEGMVNRVSRKRSMLRGLQRGTNDRGTSYDTIDVTYTITTRGQYRPPPFQQLGTIVSDSINRDPMVLVKSLKEKGNIEDEVELPPVFDDVEEANVRHLTLKNSPFYTIGGVQVYAVDSGGLARWATLPIALISVAIAGLICALLFRRLFTRREKKKVGFSDDLFRIYVKEGSGFAARAANSDNDIKDKKTKRGFVAARRRSSDDGKKKRGYRCDDDDDLRTSLAASRGETSQRSGRSGRQRTSESDSTSASQRFDQRLRRKASDVSLLESPSRRATIDRHEGSNRMSAERRRSSL